MAASAREEAKEETDGGSFCALRGVCSEFGFTFVMGRGPSEGRNEAVRRMGDNLVIIDGKLETQRTGVLALSNQSVPAVASLTQIPSKLVNRSARCCMHLLITPIRASSTDNTAAKVSTLNNNLSSCGSFYFYFYFSF